MEPKVILRIIAVILITGVIAVIIYKITKNRRRTGVSFGGFVGAIGDGYNAIMKWFGPGDGSTAAHSLPPERIHESGKFRFAVLFTVLGSFAAFCMVPEFREVLGSTLSFLWEHKSLMFAIILGWASVLWYTLKKEGLSYEKKWFWFFAAPVAITLALIAASLYLPKLSDYISLKLSLPTIKLEDWFNLPDWAWFQSTVAFITQYPWMILVGVGLLAIVIILARSKSGQKFLGSAAIVLLALGAAIYFFNWYSSLPARAVVIQPKEERAAQVGTESSRVEKKLVQEIYQISSNTFTLIPTAEQYKNQEFGRGTTGIRPVKVLCWPKTWRDDRVPCKTDICYIIEPNEDLNIPPEYGCVDLIVSVKPDGNRVKTYDLPVLYW